MLIIGWVRVGEERYVGTFVLFVQFPQKPKTAIKVKPIKNNDRSDYVICA